MEKVEKISSHELTEHFIRNEYGKIVSVLTRYVGADNLDTDEDIVQEALLKALSIEIPLNPLGWLYTTAKNLALNTLKRKTYQ